MGGPSRSSCVVSVFSALCFVLFASIPLSGKTNKTLLFSAIETGNATRVSALLDQGVDPNSRKSNTITALMWAVIHGQKRIVEILLENQADINAVTKNGTTALMLAALQGDRAMVELLLKHGADKNLKRKDRLTAYRLALDKGYKKLSTLLNPQSVCAIRKKRKRNKQLDPYLIEAVSADNLQRVKALLTNGADPNARAPFDHPNERIRHRSVIEIATMKKSYPMVKLLLENGAAPIDPALVVRKYKGGQQIFELMIDNGAKVTVDTLIDTACSGQPQMLKKLFSLGFDPKAKGIYQWTPLISASFCNNLENVLFLLQKDCNINARDNQGKTALIKAISYEKIVRALLKAGADPNIAANDGETALSLARQNGFQKQERLLIASGANPYPGDKIDAIPRTIILTWSDNKSTSEDSLAFGLPYLDEGDEVVFERPLGITLRGNRRAKGKSRVVLYLSGEVLLRGGKKYDVVDKLVIPKGTKLVAPKDGRTMLNIWGPRDSKVLITSEIALRIKPKIDSNPSTVIGFTNASSLTGCAATVRLAECRDKCTNEGRDREVRILVPTNFDLTLADNVMRVLKLAGEFASKQCPCTASRWSGIYAYIYNRKYNDPRADYIVKAVNYNKNSLNWRNQYGEMGIENRAIKAKHRQEVERVDNARNELIRRRVMAEKTDKYNKLLSASKRFQEFITDNKIAVWPITEEFVANPFVYEGKILGFYAEFKEMAAPNEGFFVIRKKWRTMSEYVFSDDSIAYVTKIPRGLFRSPKSVLLAAYPKGKTTINMPLMGKVSVPVLSFVAVENGDILSNELEKQVYGHELSSKKAKTPPPDRDVVTWQQRLASLKDVKEYAKKCVDKGAWPGTGKLFNLPAVKWAIEPYFNEETRQWLIRNLSVTTMKVINDNIVIEGCRAHACGSEEAICFINTANAKVCAVIMYGTDPLRVFGAYDRYPLLPKPVKDWIQEQQKYKRFKGPIRYHCLTDY